MNLLQKIYSKLEKKVNEVLMTRKFNAFIESELVEREEKKEKHFFYASFFLLRWEDT